MALKRVQCPQRAIAEGMQRERAAGSLAKIARLTRTSCVIYLCLIHCKYEAGFTVAVVNPFRSRKFGGSLGKLAKIDKIDAKMLAHFARSLKPEPTQPQSKHHKTLRELNVARRHAIDQVDPPKRQLYGTEHPPTVRQIRARIKMAERHQRMLEKGMHILINKRDGLPYRFAS